MLLRFAAKDDVSKTLRAETFWRDPDVRWLSGVNSAAGKEYFNQERFEELVRWLALPSLVKAGVSSASTTARNITAAVKTLQKSAYEYERYIDAVCQSVPAAEKGLA